MSTERSARKSGQKPTLSVCLIARDEADRLPSALGSVAGIADEIVVAEGGSLDRTAEVARALGACVIQVEWQDDFSKARNASLDAATGDWILCLDADERVVPGQEKKLRRLMLARADAYFVRIRSPLAGPQTGQTFVHAFQRLFRNRPQFRFQGRVHEQIYPALEAAGASVEFSDFEIEHSGYAFGRAIREEKLRRNLRLLLLDSRDRPRDALVHYHLGETYALLDEPAKARRCYELALRTGSLSAAHVAAAHQNQASVLLRLNELDLAVAEAGEALRQDPGALPSLLIAAAAKCRMGEYEQAIQTAEQYLRTIRRKARREPALLWFEPDPARAFFIRGESLYRLGRLSQAEADAVRVLEHNPKWAGGHRLLARISVAQGSLGRAEEHLRKAVALAPDQTGGWRDLALVQARGGSLADALRTIDQAVAKIRQGSLYACQGWLRIKAGDLTGAIESYQRVLELEPQSVEARRRLAGLCHKVGNTDQAREYLMKLETAKRGGSAPARTPFPASR